MEHLGLIIGGLFFLVLVGLALMHGREIFRDLKGADGRWQVVEVAHLVWIICFPAVVFSAIFGNTVEPHIIYGLDLIGGAIIGGQVYKETHPPKSEPEP